MAINPKIKQKAEDIRKKEFGSEVRESLASGIEAISEDVEATIGRQDYVEEQFQDVLDETTGKDVISGPEIIAARNGKSNLKTRLDDEHAEVTAQLQQTENFLADREVNIKFPPIPLSGAKGDGVSDDTGAIQNILNHLGSKGGGRAILPYGVFRITSGIVVPISVHMTGLGYTTDPNKKGPTVIMKDGFFKGVTLAGTSSGIEKLSIFGAANNGDAGLVLGGGRCFVNKVTVANQGGNGIEIGDLTGSNVNLFRILDIVTMFNNGHGLYIDSIGGDGNLPDVNAGYIQGVDTRSNGGDGVRVGRAMDITFISLGSQHNGGYGVRNVSGSKGMVYLAPYTEENAAGEFIFEQGSNYNIAIGYRAGEGSDSFENKGLGNLVLGRNNQIEAGLPTFNSKVGFKELIIENPSLSGYWRMKENDANRNLEVTLDGTSQSNVKAEIKHGGSSLVILNPQRLDVNNSSVGGYYLSGHKHIESGVNIGSVIAQSTKEVTVTLTGVKTRNVVNVSPDSMPSGIVWSAYVSAADTIKIRVGNVTGAEITVGTVPFSIDVWQH